MLEIDGALGEGGGQVLRSALALSLLTQTPFRLINIRARRPKPGLRAQHLKAVEAAMEIGAARVEGAALGSSQLVFVPRRIRCGDFRFDIGTAGSTSLVLQTVLLPLCRAGGASHLTITGGTHVPWSPCFDYLQLQWLPYMREIGLCAEARLERAGFYPRGGGRIAAIIQPSAAWRPLHLMERGTLKVIRGTSAVAQLDVRIAERQRRQALTRLHGRPVRIDVVNLPSGSPGAMLLLLAQFEYAQACYFALGARGKPAERVADEAVDALEQFLATDGAIDQYLADQLIVPLAFTGDISELRTSRVTQDLITNCDVVKRFLAADIRIDGKLGQPGLVVLS
jgi:RNA 3'-terminal phosphate cyclase (ATP)